MISSGMTLECSGLRLSHSPWYKNSGWSNPNGTTIHFKPSSLTQSMLDVLSIFEHPQALPSKGAAAEIGIDREAF